jgi:hypothetical protein
MPAELQQDGSSITRTRSLRYRNMIGSGLTYRLIMRSNERATERLSLFEDRVSPLPDTAFPSFPGSIAEMKWASLS